MAVGDWTIYKLWVAGSSTGNEERGAGKWILHWSLQKEPLLPVSVLLLDFWFHSRNLKSKFQLLLAIHFVVTCYSSYRERLCQLSQKGPRGDAVQSALAPGLACPKCLILTCYPTLRLGWGWELGSG